MSATALSSPDPDENNPDKRIVPIDASLQAEASSANARINVPLNLSAWRSRPDAEQKELLWFHQHILDDAMSWGAVEEALGFERSTIFRLLKGTYQAESWHKPIQA